MSTFKSVMRKVLNLPEPRRERKPDLQSVEHQKPEPERASLPAGAARWVAAGQRVKAEQPANSRTAVAVKSQQTREPSAPWRVEEENSGAKFFAKFGRVVLWLVVALAAITGVRSWFWPAQAPKASPVQVQQGPTYPVQEAQAIASRFAYSYLSWDEAAPQDRAKALARDMPKGIDTTAGWNSKGKQDVIAALPGAVAELSDKRARVHVDVLVSTPAQPAKDKEAAKPAEQKWMGLEVPVLYSSNRIVVTGEPGIVGVPTSGPSVTDQPAADSDVQMSDMTKSTVDAFFAAYAKGESDAVTAPGATVPPLPAGMTLGGVQSWNVDRGKGSNRTGTAVVRWQVAGAELEQTYRVELTRVASAAAERWQVAQVYGGAS